MNKKYKNKKLEDLLIIKLFISSQIDADGRGLLLRDIIFSKNTILPEIKQLKEMILHRNPQLALNKRFMEI